MKIEANNVFQCLPCATLCYPSCNFVIPLLCPTKFLNAFSVFSIELIYS